MIRWVVNPCACVVFDSDAYGWSSAEIATDISECVSMKMEVFQVGVIDLDFALQKLDNRLWL